MAIQNGPTSVAGSRGTPASILEDTLVLPFNDLEACRTLLTANRGRVGTVIVEPSPRAFYQTDPAFLEGLRALTRELGMVPHFRRGDVRVPLRPQGCDRRFWSRARRDDAGQDHRGAGFPVGAVVGREDLLDLTSPLASGGSVFHSGTFNGAVQVLAAGLATLDILSDDSRTRPFYEATEEFKEGIRRLPDRPITFPGTWPASAPNFGVIMSEMPIRNYRDLARENGSMREAFDFACLTEGSTFTLTSRSTRRWCTRPRTTRRHCRSSTRSFAAIS